MTIETAANGPLHLGRMKDKIEAVHEDMVIVKISRHDAEILAQFDTMGPNWRPFERLFEACRLATEL